MKVGVVGCGRIGTRHVDAYRQLGGVDLVVADDDPARAKTVAERWDVPVVPPEHLLDEDLDAVDVCVPSVAHQEWIVAALGSGRHVFCEKPLCLSHAEGVAIRAAAVRSRRSVVVGYLYRHHPAFRFAKETIDHGIIGDPYFALARLGGRGSHRPWKHDDRTGGGVVFEMMVHMLDLLSWVLGPLDDGRVVYEDLLLPQRVIDGEAVSVSASDCAVVTCRAGGVRSICQSDLVTPSFMNHVEVQGSNGSLVASILDFLPTVVYCNEPRVLFDRGHNYRQFGPTNLFVKELGSFLDLVRSDAFEEWSLLESLELARFVDCMLGREPAADDH
ncbi:MAG TPA: Gfo/Idh/MocA family oxidoreductase [Acidimicrobiales bacterium]|nr:Gfo/Idh/MocA family oxidoreductase [Acidimicrobiales bacterium]